MARFNQLSICMHVLMYIHHAKYDCYIFDTFSIGVNGHCYMYNRLIITVNSVLFNFAICVFFIHYIRYFSAYLIDIVSPWMQCGTDFFCDKTWRFISYGTKQKSCVAQDKLLIHQFYGEVARMVDMAVPIIECASPPLCLRNKPRRFATARSWIINYTRNTKKIEKKVMESLPLHTSITYGNIMTAKYHTSEILYSDKRNANSLAVALRINSKYRIQMVNSLIW